MRPDALALLLALLAGPAGADGLEGRTVLIRVETWNDPKAPLLESRDYVAEVGPGPEFGVTFEGSFGFGVVPVIIDLGARRIDFSYAGNAPGFFAQTRFNGYVLTFPVECTLFTGAALDGAATTLGLTEDDLTVTPQSLEIDVSGLAYGPEDRIGVTLDVTDCTLS